MCGTGVLCVCAYIYIFIHLSICVCAHFWVSLQNDGFPYVFPQTSPVLFIRPPQLISCLALPPSLLPVTYSTHFPFPLHSSCVLLSYSLESFYPASFSVMIPQIPKYFPLNSKNNCWGECESRGWGALEPTRGREKAVETTQMLCSCAKFSNTLGNVQEVNSLLDSLFIIVF